MTTINQVVNISSDNGVFYEDYEEVRDEGSYCGLRRSKLLDRIGVSHNVFRCVS